MQQINASSGLQTRVRPVIFVMMTSIFIEYQNIRTPIIISNEQTLYATKIGTIHVRVLQGDGSYHSISLHNVKYIPEFGNSLFSIGTALSRGWKISSQGINITLTKDGTD
jgi:hypothetical protein